MSRSDGLREGEEVCQDLSSWKRHSSRNIIKINADYLGIFTAPHQELLPDSAGNLFFSVAQTKRPAGLILFLLPINYILICEKNRVAFLR